MTVPGSGEPEASPASLADLALCLARARWRLAAWAFAGLALASAWAAFSGPSFRAEATILIEQQGTSGLLGDLAMLASLSSAPATASELSVLESRTLAEGVAADGTDGSGAWNPLDERSAGLATRVDDLDLRPLALLRRALFAPPPPSEPLVLPPRGLNARATPRDGAAPALVRLAFVGGGRVRIARAGWLAALHLVARAEEERDFTPRTPFDYQGLTLELEPWGEFEGATFELEAVPRHEALRRLQDQLSVRETALNSGVIEVAVTDSDPRRAARTVNALCKRYLDSLAARGQRRASRTVEYVQGILAEEQQRFERDQDLITRVQQEHPELAAPEDAASSLIDQMSQLEIQRVQIELSQHAFAEIVSALDAGDRRALAQIDNSLNVGVLADPVTSGLLAELARLDAQASTLGTDLVEGHPLLERNDAAARALVERTREQLQSRLAGFGSRLADLQGVERELRARLSEMPESMRRMAEAEVELDIHRELVPYLIKSLQGAEITRSSAETLADLVDPAAPPDELDAPDFARLAALGVLLGLVLGTGVVIAREPRRGRVYRADELAEALGAEGAVTLARLAPRALVFAKARTSAAAETLRRLRGRLRFAPDGGVRRAIGVATLGGGEDGPALAAELALAFESEGRRTLVVEVGAPRPALGACFGLEPASGLAAHLATGEPWSERVRTSASGPAVLQWGEGAAEAGDLLARAEAAHFLAEAGARYDAVVLALPAAESLAAAPGFVRALDVLCLAHRARSLSRARLVAAAADLRAAGARALYAVLVEKRA